MNFLEFAEKAVLIDKRNTFSQFSGDLSEVPEEMRAFYREANPADVEVGFVRFVSAEKLHDLQSEYAHIGAQFVFATCNGDPIFLQDGCVYTCPHGVKTPKHELLSDNIKTYLSDLITENL